MAGDIQLAESLIVSVPGEASAMAASRPILHEYGTRIKIAIGKGGPPGAPVNEDSLSNEEKLGLSAFKDRLSDGYKHAKAARPHAASSWAGEDGQPRLHRDGEVNIPESSMDDGSPPFDAPEARRLAGRIAVGIVIVSGPGHLSMTRAQQQTIIAEVQNGLSYLGGAAPARDVTFAYDIRIVEIDAPDATGYPDAGGNAAYDYFENGWRDAAQTALGYSAGAGGIRDYIRQIKSEKRAQAAYCAFFTHYTLYHFAYCRGSYLVMHYDNDGWGTENLDRVFAHETGHIFGAPDEYAESGCDCGGSHGYYGRPNINCENCADGGGVSCIMKKNTWDMCSETPYHLGYTMNVS